MEFLGHQVGGNVITPSRDNLVKVRNTPRPTTKEQVRSLLDLVGYYRDHIPAFAQISAPLTDLLKKGKAELFPVEQGTGACILPTKRIPVAGASAEASRLRYQEVQTLLGWKEIYAPDGPQALEIPKGRRIPE